MGPGSQSVWVGGDMLCALRRIFLEFGEAEAKGSRGRAEEASDSDYAGRVKHQSSGARKWKGGNGNEFWRACHWGEGKRRVNDVIA
jgi:hypothetical protein